MRGTIRTFRDLVVWQKSHELVLSVYDITKKFPAEEKFGIVSQLRRSASSVPTNIVEGHKRKSKKDFLHFLNLADSSLEETKYHLILSLDLKYLDALQHKSLSENCDEVGKLLSGLQKSLQN